MCRMEYRSRVIDPWKRYVAECFQVDAWIWNLRNKGEYWRRVICLPDDGITPGY